MPENFEYCKVVSKQELKEKRMEIVRGIFKEVCLVFNFEIGDGIIDNCFKGWNKQV